MTPSFEMWSVYARKLLLVCHDRKFQIPTTTKRISPSWLLGACWLYRCRAAAATIEAQANSLKPVGSFPQEAWLYSPGSYVRTWLASSHGRKSS